MASFLNKILSLKTSGVKGISTIPELKKQIEKSELDQSLKSAVLFECPLSSDMSKVLVHDKDLLITRSILAALDSAGKFVVVLDEEGVCTAKQYGLGSTDLIFNPMDERSFSWHILKDITDLEDASANIALIKEHLSNQYDLSHEYIITKAVDLVEAVVIYLFKNKDTSANSLYTLLIKSNSQVLEEITGLVISDQDLIAARHIISNYIFDWNTFFSSDDYTMLDDAVSNDFEGTIYVPLLTSLATESAKFSQQLMLDSLLKKIASANKELWIISTCYKSNWFIPHLEKVLAKKGHLIEVVSSKPKFFDIQDYTQAIIMGSAINIEDCAYFNQTAGLFISEYSKIVSTMRKQAEAKDGMSYVRCKDKVIYEGKANTSTIKPASAKKLEQKDDAPLPVSVEKYLIPTKPLSVESITKVEKPMATLMVSPVSSKSNDSQGDAVQVEQEVAKVARKRFELPSSKKAKGL